MRWLAILLCLLSLATVARAEDFSRVAAATDRGMGRVLNITDQSSGSGFVVSKGAGGIYFLTNNHVVAGGPNAKILVIFREGSDLFAYQGRVVAASRGKDLAVMRLTALDRADPSMRAIAIAPGTIAKGKPVAAVGYPGIADAMVASVYEASNRLTFFSSTLTTGNVSRVFSQAWKGQRERIEILQHTATINHGNSGGPLLNQCGEVVGVNTQGLKNEIFLASSARTVRSFLDGAGIPYQKGQPCSGAGTMAAAPSDAVPPASQGKSAGSSGERKPPASSAPTAVPSPSQARPATSEPPDFAPSTPSEGGGPTDQRWLALAALGVVVLGLLGFALFRRPEAGRGAGGPGRPVPTPRGAPVLVAVVHGGTAPLETPISAKRLAGGVIFGRGTEADFDLGASEVSRRHLRLELQGRRLLLTDLGSANGTTVDGKPLQSNVPYQVNTASRVRLGGKIELSFRKLS